MGKAGIIRSEVIITNPATNAISSQSTRQLNHISITALVYRSAAAPAVIMIFDSGRKWDNKLVNGGKLK